MILQSIGWWCFVPQKLTPAQFVSSAAEAGFTALDLVPPEYWSLVIDHGLTISSIQGHLPLEIGLNRVDQHERIEQEVRAAIANAQRLRIPNVLCFSGNRGGLDDAKGMEVTVAALRKLAPFVEEAGVTLVLELLNSKVDHPDYQADRTAWGAQVCQAVGSPRVKLLYDIYHMQIMEGDVIRTIRTFHPLIAFYHTAGNPGRNDLDETQELNYAAILKAIKETGYTGYIAHEFIPKADPVAALGAMFKQSAPWL
ncbi:MAG: TIM barrel protein [Verrucomicrobia bacterium]|nr:TIM barrel protein [Verrucomicrobiota bacterium]